MASRVILAVLLCGAIASATQISSRIVGGSDASIQNHPSIVAVEHQGVFSGIWTQQCGGSILTSRWILSAANCFQGALYEPRLRRVRAGSSVRHTGGILSNVVRAINHPSFGSNGYDGDIAVVEIETALAWTPAVQPGTIISQDFAFPAGLPVTIAGWGHTSTNGLPSTNLQEATVLTIDQESCRNSYGQLSVDAEVTGNMVCAGLPGSGGVDACQGDAGGPVYYDGIIMGIVSWGWECGRADYPGVSTAVSSYTNWIIAAIQ